MRDQGYNEKGEKRVKDDNESGITGRPLINGNGASNGNSSANGKNSRVTDSTLDAVEDEIQI